MKGMTFNMMSRVTHTQEIQYCACVAFKTTMGNELSITELFHKYDMIQAKLLNMLMIMVTDLISFRSCRDIPDDS